jgi:hypothetical protein
MLSRSRWRRRICRAALGIGLLASDPAFTETLQGSAAPSIPSTVAQASPRTLPFDDAVASAARRLLANLPRAAADKPVELVIDPLVDGATGVRTVAAAEMGQRIAALAASEFPHVKVASFSREALVRSPVLLIGTITAINEAGQVSGPRDAYAIWLTAADLKTGEIVAKVTSRAVLAEVDGTPVPAHIDSPVWREDAPVQGYIDSCRKSQVGQKLASAYVEQLPVSAVLADAEMAYAARDYRRALTLYQEARALPGGRQLRVLNGLYIVQARLGGPKATRNAFAELIDYGLEGDKLSTRLLFRPGTAAFVRTREARSYPMWLTEIAGRAAARLSCLEVVGHTSPTGPKALNERLSLLRAEHVRDRLLAASGTLAPRIIAHGAGSRENLIGTGRDDASDALDRRVEFNVVPCT